MARGWQKTGSDPRIISPVRKLATWRVANDAVLSAVSDQLAVA